jgi:hypothetical protein
VPNPDIPDWLVHFTGRPESFPPVFNLGTVEGWTARSRHADEQRVLAQQRLDGIFTIGGILARQGHGTVGPVVCFSELTFQAIQVQLATGFVGGRKPAYEPWGLVLHKGPLLAMGVRPVLYLSQEERDLLSSAPASLRDRMVRSVPGDPANDWTHEREWRLTFGDATPQNNIPWGVPLAPATVRAVIVGVQGWQPARPYASFGPIARWLWTGSGLFDDGVL